MIEAALNSMVLWALQRYHEGVVIRAVGALRGRHHNIDTPEYPKRDRFPNQIKCGSNVPERWPAIRIADKTNRSLNRRRKQMRSRENRERSPP